MAKKFLFALFILLNISTFGLPVLAASNECFVTGQIDGHVLYVHPMNGVGA